MAEHNAQWSGSVLGFMHVVRMDLIIFIRLKFFFGRCRFGLKCACVFIELTFYLKTPKRTKHEIAYSLEHQATFSHCWSRNLSSVWTTIFCKMSNLFLKLLSSVDGGSGGEKWQQKKTNFFVDLSAPFSVLHSRNSQKSHVHNKYQVNC